MDHKLSQSPSIKDLSMLATPAGSTVSLPKEPNAPEKSDISPDVGFFTLRPIQPDATQAAATPRSNDSASKTVGGQYTSHYASAKVASNSNSTFHDKDRLPVAHSSNSHFDHQQELKDIHNRGIDEQTFGNQNSKRSIFEHEELFKITEHVGQENPIVRPSGSKASLKQVEDVAPSSATNEDRDMMPNSSTAPQSSFTGPIKQDSQ